MKGKFLTFLFSFLWASINNHWNCRHFRCVFQHRRHFSAVACHGCIYAVGGWYLDSLVTPDSNTALYTAVERYDPWEDTWRFVAGPQSALPQPVSQITTALKPSWTNAIHHPGLCPRCRSRTFGSPCPCLTTSPSPPASATVSMCWAVFRGLGRSCCCSTTQGKVWGCNNSLRITPAECFSFFFYYYYY